MAVDVAKVKQLLAPLGANSIADSFISLMGEQALMPDNQGVYPGRPEYVETFDYFYLAYLLVDVVAANSQQVTNVNSEGTSVTVAPVDFDAVKLMYGNLSPIIAKVRDIDRFNRVSIDMPVIVRRVNMVGVSDDIDSDMG